MGVVVVIWFAELFADKGVGVLEEEVCALRVGVTRAEVKAQGFAGAEAATGLRGQAGATGADDVSLYGGDEVGACKGVADIGLTEAGLDVLGQFDADAGDGIGYMMA